MPSSRTTVLVVEDDAAARQVMRLVCESGQLDVVEAATGADALGKIRQSQPDVILLDVSLPDLSGLEVCRQIRAAGVTAPVIMVSGHGDLIDVVVGIEVGADDYVLKPYNVRELLARIAAHLRRHTPSAPSARQRLELPGLVIDLAGRRVLRGNQEVALTVTQFDLLVLLASREGDAVSRSEMLLAMWGVEPDIDSRTIDAHIHRLRRKIDNEAMPKGYIETVPGVGYRLNVRPEAAAESLSVA
jgi:DNA-binding response OmpR family regulator